MTQKETVVIDMSAVARVSKRVNLTQIVLVELKANRRSEQRPGVLEAKLSHEHKVLAWDAKTIQLESRYDFVGIQGDIDAIDAAARFELSYTVEGDAPLIESDVRQFGSANGAYHSWPFVRELLFGLTSRMGFPAFTLPVLTFIPQRKATEAPAQPDKKV